MISIVGMISLPKNKTSIQKGYGPVCESKIISEYWEKQQITIDELLKEMSVNDRSSIANY